MRVRSLTRFITELDWRQRCLLMQAAHSLLLASVLIRILPFNRLTAWLRLQPAETAFTVDCREEVLAARIGWAICAAANRSPLEIRCLVQALAATLVSRWYGLRTTLYLGVARAEDGELQAHAWSRCGSCVITGRAQQPRFAVLARFTS